jgi:hypothetical protein
MTIATIMLLAIGLGVGIGAFEEWKTVRKNKAK